MKCTPSRLAALISISLLACASLAHAGDPVNVIFASTTIDNMDAFDQDCSLREAIHNASNNTQFSPVINECPAGSALMTDVIRLAGGATYELTLAGAGNDAGDLDLFQNVPIALDLRFETDGGVATIQQTVAGQRVIENNGLTVELDNVVVRGGSIDGAGGGILNSGGTLHLNHVNIFSNSSNAGGGIHNTGTVFATNSQFQLNTASFIGGGAIFNSGSGDVYLDNVLLRANTAPAGGAIYNEGDELQLINGSSVSLNQANDSHGGAIFNQGNARLMVDGASFENNNAQGNGGGIYTISQNDSFIVNSSFVNHNAVLGGAVYQFGTAHLMVSGSSFSGNSSASDGGAIRIGNGTISASLFEGNTAFLGEGGAIWGSNFIKVINNTVVRNNTAVSGGGIRAQLIDLLDSRIEMNSANEFGGGVRVTNRGKLAGVQIVNNTSADGAGLYLNSGGVMTTEIGRSLFTDNQATGNGGGIWLGSDTLIGNTTITLNGANSGGGGMYINDTADVTAVNMTLQGHLNGQDLHKFGKLTMGNSIIYTPGQPDCETTINDPPIYTLGNNVVDDNSCFFDQVLPSDQVVANPMLDQLADNGGGTMTLALLPGSALIDAGSNLLCAAAPVDGVDQRGAPRPEGAACDIGAHEQGSVAPSIDEIFKDGFEQD